MSSWTKLITFFVIALSSWTKLIIYSDGIPSERDFRQIWKATLRAQNNPRSRCLRGFLRPIWMLAYEPAFKEYLPSLSANTALAPLLRFFKTLLTFQGVNWSPTAVTISSGVMGLP